MPETGDTSLTTGQPAQAAQLANPHLVKAFRDNYNGRESQHFYSLIEEIDRLVAFEGDPETTPYASKYNALSIAVCNCTIIGTACINTFPSSCYIRRFC